MTTSSAPDPTHPHPPPSPLLTGLSTLPSSPSPTAPRVVYSDSHVRLTTETLVLKKFLPLHTRYVALDEITSIYPTTELREQAGVVGRKLGRVVWGMDLKNLRLMVDCGKGEEKRRRSVVLETKGILRRVGFSVNDPEGFWKALDEVRDARTQ